MDREPGTPWTTKELAERVHLSDVQIRRLCIAGTIAARKVGRDWNISDEEAQRFIEERRGRWEKF